MTGATLASIKIIQVLESKNSLEKHTPGEKNLKCPGSPATGIYPPILIIEFPTFIKYYQSNYISKPLIHEIISCHTVEADPHLAVYGRRHVTWGEVGSSVRQRR